MVIATMFWGKGIKFLKFIKILFNYRKYTRSPFSYVLSR